MTGTTGSMPRWPRRLPPPPRPRPPPPRTPHASSRPASSPSPGAAAAEVLGPGASVAPVCAARVAALSASAPTCAPVCWRLLSPAALSCRTQARQTRALELSCGAGTMPAGGAVQCCGFVQGSARTVWALRSERARCAAVRVDFAVAPCSCPRALVAAAVGEYLAHACAGRCIGVPEAPRRHGNNHTDARN